LQWLNQLLNMDRQAPGGSTSFSFGWGDASGKRLIKPAHLP
jgi:hypothetical protein